MQTKSESKEISSSHIKRYSPFASSIPLKRCSTIPFLENINFSFNPLPILSFGSEYPSGITTIISIGLGFNFSILFNNALYLSPAFPIVLITTE